MAPVSPVMLLSPDHTPANKVAELVKLRTSGLTPELAWPNSDPLSNHPSWAHWSKTERTRFFGFIKEAYPKHEFPFTEETLFSETPVLPPPSYFEGDLPIVEYGGPPQDPSLTSPRPNPDSDWLTEMMIPRPDDYVKFADVEIPGLAGSPYRSINNLTDVSVLSFAKTCTVNGLEMSSNDIMSSVPWHVEKKKFLEAAFLTALSVQHRVLVLDSTYSIEAKANATQSFPDDIFGPWAPPYGDIVILPKFSGSRSACQQILKEVKQGLDNLSKHAGKFQEDFIPEVCDESDFIPGTLHREDYMDETAMRLRHLAGRVPITKAPKKNSIFRPAFSNYMFRLGSVKMRLAAELLQAAIIVLLKSVDMALLRKDHGAALYFVQLTRTAVIKFLWLLRYKPLQASYLFGLYKFYEGKCYALLNFNPSAGERYVEVRKLFEGAEKTFEALEEEFLEELNATGHGDLIYECEIRLPSSSMNCLAVAYQAFYGIAIAPSWKRAWVQKEVIAITYLSRHISLWKFCVASEYIRTDQDQRLNHLNKIRALLDGAVSEPHVSRLGRACLFLLTAQVYQLKNVWQQACAQNAMSRQYHAVRYPKYTNVLEVRGKCMRGAMLEMADEMYSPQVAEDFLKLSRETLRSIYVLIATKAFCDGVFDQLLYLGEVDKVYDTCFQPLFNMMVLMQNSLAPWVDKPYVDATGEYRLKVNQSDGIHVNQILGLLFYGTALIYFKVIGGNTPTTEAQRDLCKENAFFYLTLAMAYIRRPGVAVAIIRRVSDFALNFDRCLLQVAMKTLRSPFGRATTVLNVFFFLLPMLWELCIDAVEDGPVGYTGISLSKPVLPLPLTTIKSKVRQDEFKLYECLLNYVKTDLDLDGQKSVALKAYTAESTPCKTKEVEHLPHQCAGELNTFQFNFEFVNSDGEKRPPIPSRYPWGEYHQIERHIVLREEFTSNIQPFYSLDVFKALLANFNEQVFSPDNDLESAAKDVLANVEFLCNLIDETLANTDLKIYMGQTSNIELKPSEVCAAIRMSRVYKMQRTSPVVSLTRTMSKLEKVLCGGALTSLMRGEMD